jgi:hypothetical protein
VGQHIEDDAAAVALAVIPARPLRWLPVAFENPVAEFAAPRTDKMRPKNPPSTSRFSFIRPGRNSLS